MTKSSRDLTPLIQRALDQNKMAFVGGPRQVGKTTLAAQFLDSQSRKDPGYLNWDVVRAKKMLLAGILPGDVSTVVLDEVHKFPRWRNLVKGIFDERNEELRIIVTGSARLDLYRRGGDSLLGRYRYLRLHPFTLDEMDTSCSRDSARTLLQFGGFPEPLFLQSERDLRLWQRERQSRVIREDLIELEQIRSLSQIQLLAQLLPERVGSPLSLQSLREDLGSSHDAVSNWVRIFDALYLTYRISPWGPSRTKALKKEQKLYFWDWSILKNAGIRFENMVASHLLKLVHRLEDSEGVEMDLRYFRDREKREVDFVVLKDQIPVHAVECKAGDTALSPALQYFLERSPLQTGFQVHLGTRDFEKRLDNGKSIRMIPFEKWVRIIRTLENP